ncbi:hypothetical protein JCM17846_32190 [Iodidimonas nitroreducens]|uniref:MobA-like NTP transferase domain-containing protein n=1 Tax=Iodidimonas nitroreducens TaxID=1236968 RepID=A0A5A7NC79_9PROT|nr:nucleotidyltransferase family protein [Iodidimonas nitroreducens]GAK33995.1 molybdopterin-guanine dinucleotide biosynthesis protein A [alpha proteobacterium Q-1]GER05537.1 hypothetical protein JCM17846_32190 [Iodidimonas nitroreducens]
MPPLSYRALILSGRRSSGDPVADAEKVSSKAFAHVGGRPMIDHVIRAVEGSGRMADIQISLPQDCPIEREAPGLAARLARGELLRHQSKEGPSGSVLSVLQAMKPGERLFVTTADHPLLTSDLVCRFLDEADKLDADIAAALAPLDVVKAAREADPADLPPRRGRRTRLAFKDGVFSGCNMFALKAPAAERGIALWQRIEHDRKKPVRLVARLGVWGLLNWLAGRLTLADALGRLGRRVDLLAMPVIMRDADAATDIDSLDDLAMVRAVFARQKARAASPSIDSSSIDAHPINS